MKLCVIGLGYIGLPTSAMFASHGCEVVGVDVMPNVVETLNKGRIHIEEPGLEEVVKSCVENGTFRASLKAEEADAYNESSYCSIYRYFSCSCGCSV